MCYSAIPGQTGFLAIREVASKPVPAPKKKKGVTEALVSSVAPARAVAPQMESMSHDLIGSCGDSRRYNRYDSLRGKRLAKRQHKPNWRNYGKY